MSEFFKKLQSLVNPVDTGQPTEELGSTPAPLEGSINWQDEIDQSMKIIRNSKLDKYQSTLSGMGISLDNFPNEETDTVQPSSVTDMFEGQKQYDGSQKAPSKVMTRPTGPANAKDVGVVAGNAWGMGAGAVTQMPFEAMKDVAMQGIAGATDTEVPRGSLSVLDDNTFANRMGAELGENQQQVEDSRQRVKTSAGSGGLLSLELAGAAPGLAAVATKVGVASLGHTATMLPVLNKLKTTAAAQWGDSALSRITELGKVLDDAGPLGVIDNAIRGLAQGKGVGNMAARAGVGGGLSGTTALVSDVLTNSSDDWEETGQKAMSAAIMGTVMQPVLGDVAIPLARFLFDDGVATQAARSLMPAVADKQSIAAAEEAINNLKPGDNIAGMRIMEEADIDNLRATFGFIANRSYPVVKGEDIGSGRAAQYASNFRKAVAAYEDFSDKVRGRISNRMSKALGDPSSPGSRFAQTQRERAKYGKLFEQLNNDRLAADMTPEAIGGQLVNNKNVLNSVKRSLIGNTKRDVGSFSDADKAVYEVIAARLNPKRKVLGKETAPTVANLARARKELADMAYAPTGDQGGIPAAQKVPMFKALRVLDEEIAKAAGFTKEMRAGYAKAKQKQEMYELAENFWAGRTLNLGRQTNKASAASGYNQYTLEDMERLFEDLDAGPELKEAFREGFAYAIHQDLMGAKKPNEVFRKMFGNTDARGEFDDPFQAGPQNVVETVLGKKTTDDLKSIWAGAETYDFTQEMEDFMRQMYLTGDAKVPESALINSALKQYDKDAGGLLVKSERYMRQWLGLSDYSKANAALDMLTKPTHVIKSRLRAGLERAINPRKIMGPRLGAGGGELQEEDNFDRFRDGAIDTTKSLGKLGQALYNKAANSLTGN